ncbi:MAG: transcription factor S [Candidatus Hydrothermarchaeota archaeon]|nr:transcription factor S [Candidatus Hydrothermarchaeota archaeon]
MSELFCEKCGGMMLPKGKALVCTRCKTKKEILNRNDFKLIQVNKKQQKLLIVDEEIQTLPTTRVECPKCKNNLAEWWLLQTRKADESETRFYRCTKCKFTWREYS